MNVTVFSLFMSVLFSTIFILIIHVFRNKEFFLRSFGIHTVLLLYGICTFRLCFSIETPMTVPVNLNEFSRVFEVVKSEKAAIGGVSFSILELLGWVWFIGVIITLVVFLGKYFFGLYLLSRYTENRDPLADQMLQAIQEENPGGPVVSVCICPKVDIPMGVGLWHKHIALPAEKFTEEELYYILKHEYTHICNRDLLVKMLSCLFCCVFWWNPVVYLLRKDISQILEIQCDMAATRGFSKKDILGYLGIIFHLLSKKEKASKKSSASPKAAAQLFSFNRKANERDILTRFTMLTKPVQKTAKVYQSLLLALTLLILVASYSFVLQPYYEPPKEEICTDTSVRQFDLSEAYVLKQKDGSFILVLENGEEYPISTDSVEAFIIEGFQLKEE